MGSIANVEEPIPLSFNFQYRLTWTIIYRGFKRQQWH